MAGGYNLARLYMGAGWTPSEAKKAGSSLATIGATTSSERRRRLLQAAIASGKVKPGDLGPSDAQTAGLSANAKSPNLASSLVGNPLKDLIGGIGNLGSDIFQAGRYFVPGLYETGKAGLQDSLLGAALGVNKPGSQLNEKVIKPTLESYKYMYGPATHGDFGKTLSRMYEHPLQPILDAATVASLGMGSAAKAGGVVARNAESASLADLGKRMASLTSPEGRASMDLGGGVTVPRDYGTAPLRRLSQRAYDRLAGTSAAGPTRFSSERLGKLQTKFAVARDVRHQGALRKSSSSDAMQTALRTVGRRVAELDPDEMYAFRLALGGVNTPERLATWRQSVEKTLRNEHPEEEDHKNIRHYQEDFNVDPAYVQSRLDAVNPRVEMLIVDPSQSPRLMAAADAYKASSEYSKQRMGIDDKDIEDYVKQRLDRLGGDDPADYPIQPDYVPDMVAKGFTVQEPGKIKGWLRGNDPKVGVERGNYDPRDITAQNLLSTPSKKLMSGDDDSTFMAGVFRTDGRALLDHIARREREIVDAAFNRDMIDTYALRDENGKARTFKSPQDVPEGWVAVNDEFPIQFYNAEVDMMEGVLNAAEQLERHHSHDEHSQEAMQYFIKLQNEHASAFVRSQLNAMKRPAMAIPREVFNYQMQIAKVNDPYRFAAANWAAKWMHRWRTATLAYMPRWAVNTAVGSFMMAMIRGVLDPRDYITGNRLARTYTNTRTGEAAVKPGVLHPRARKQWEQDNADIMEPDLPPGVDLRSVALQDYLEPGIIGRDYDSIGSAKFNSRRIVDAVQSVEDFFRRAHFVKNLRGEAKQLMRDRGEDLKTFYKDLSDNPMIDDWLNSPELTERALKMTDRWSYAYGELGPFERRYLRQVIPFWGWYKFITKFAWRMGVDTPGRTQLVNQLSGIGKDAEDELGLVPPWVRGSIILNSEGGKLKYLSTMGMNPLAQFANPAQAVAKGDLNSLITMGQGSPLVQAALSAMGVDTLRGGAVSISPESGVGPGFFGQMVDENTGVQVNPAERSALRRFGMGLFRSVPMGRMGEQFITGGSSYPESIPLIDPRPMPRSPDAPPLTVGDTLLYPALGFNTNQMDLKKWQSFTAEQAANAKSRNRNTLRKIARTTR
jgi:hypothetical protein